MCKEKILNEFIESVQDLIMKEKAGNEWNAIAYYNHWAVVSHKNQIGNAYIVARLLSYIEDLLNTPHESRLLFDAV